MNKSHHTHRHIGIRRPGVRLISVLALMSAAMPIAPAMAQIVVYGNAAAHVQYAEPYGGLETGNGGLAVPSGSGTCDLIASCIHVALTEVYAVRRAPNDIYGLPPAIRDEQCYLRLYTYAEVYGAAKDMSDNHCPDGDKYGTFGILPGVQANTNLRDLIVLQQDFLF